MHCPKKVKISQKKKIELKKKNLIFLVVNLKLCQNFICDTLEYLLGFITQTLVDPRENLLVEQSVLLGLRLVKKIVFDFYVQGRNSGG